MTQVAAAKHMQKSKQFVSMWVNRFKEVKNVDDFLNRGSVQSMPRRCQAIIDAEESAKQRPGPSQPLLPNQPPPRNVLKYHASDNNWYLNGALYGIPIEGTIVYYKAMEVCKQPYCRQRRRQVKLGKYNPVEKEARLIPPTIKEGDIQYRRKAPIGIVGKDHKIWEYHPSHGGKSRIVKAMDGDTLVLNGQWTTNTAYGIYDNYKKLYGYNNYIGHK
ncbi:uncharacterized protein LOC117175428 [Belonocnema kinseyi]|uniref:uncharacterized protein LOC117175428 n=1 Tax=Belonocnema kinseyi TaxID=2817044 RepID=UPI00143E06C0|nr:uncharacterized protein LOC117175428 [Belonocnema kinseyi]